MYSVWDMLRYNRARRAEWIEAQKKFEADELATARIAYLKGDATEEQILLVEEANREAEEKGIKLPSLLSPPEHRTHFEEHVKSAFEVNLVASLTLRDPMRDAIFFSFEGEELSKRRLREN